MVCQKIWRHKIENTQMEKKKQIKKYKKKIAFLNNFVIVVGHSILAVSPI